MPPLSWWRTAHKHIEREPLTDENRWRVITEAASEVGPALFFSLLIITLSFLPVFTLEAQEGRLFAPLAFTKTYAMAAAAGLSVTLVPVLMGYFIRGRVTPEHKNPTQSLADGRLSAGYQWRNSSTQRSPWHLRPSFLLRSVARNSAWLGVHATAGRG